MLPIGMKHVKSAREEIAFWGYKYEKKDRMQKLSSELKLIDVAH